MCYSALVEQDVRKLERGFRARVDEHAFLETFRERTLAAQRALDGEKNVRKVTLTKALEDNFLKDLQSAAGRSTKEEILKWRALERARFEREIENQAARVATAETALNKRRTKKAENDLRIGSSKVRKARRDLEDLDRRTLSDEDSFVWPKYHFPGLVVVDGERLIRPYRYLIRPDGQPASFDGKYNGAYNAQQERLQEVFFWRELLGRHHGIMLVHRFRERQDEVPVAGKAPLVAVGSEKPRGEYEFDPGSPISVPFLWDHWRDPSGTEADLESAAAITCEPSDEIRAHGILRLLTPVNAQNLETWLETSRQNLDRYQKLLADYAWPSLKYREVA